MYVLLVRPQQRKVREQRDLVRRVGVGAEVQTIGGILGRVVAADDQYVHLEISPGVVVTFVRAAVGRILEQAPDDETPDFVPDDLDLRSDEGGPADPAGAIEPPGRVDHVGPTGDVPPGSDPASGEEHGGPPPGATGTEGGLG